MSLPKIEGEKKLEWNCGNGITEIGEIFFCQLWQCHCRKWEERKMWLPKSGKEFKKKCVTFTIFLQYFHNKSQVISYYQFKFEFNTEITFLIQQ